MMLQLKIPEHIEPYWAEVTQTKYYQNAATTCKM